MIDQLLKGLLLGIGAAAPLGPVNVEIARRTLRGGFLAGFALGCGAVTVDVTYAILSSLGFRILADKPLIFWPLSIGGVLLLCYLGGMSWRDAIRAMRAPPSDDLMSSPPPSLHGGYVTGLLMTLVNPMTLLFWFTSVPSTVAAMSNAAGAGSGRSGRPEHDLPMICTGVFLGTIAWVICFASTLKFAGRWRRQGWMIVADAFGGTMLLLFAAYAAWNLFARLRLGSASGGA